MNLFISQIKTSPDWLLRQMTSLLPSPLKSYIGVTGTENSTLTSLSVVIATEHWLPVVVSQPVQAVTVEPCAGVAVRITVVSVEYDARHVLPSLLQLSVPVDAATVPLPLPVVLRVRVAKPPGSCVTVNV
ncbi:hypothetical protein MBAV_003954 [Candidatus Magnetobacterium bavaricum]|uniref:Uncharacterized protein n=1 Tax=Candidatus Magnetobacterium bavaricum TaxID=29290 RepID=A0A0F3GPJ8_9BACT|nr:hypothetical protein MBAV_003954 [Candidatus Magnetobacterium bavaricum]